MIRRRLISNATLGGRGNTRIFVASLGWIRNSWTIVLAAVEIVGKRRPKMLRLRFELATQEKLSFEAGLDRTYISHLENNKKSPTVDVLFRLCTAMGIRASE